MLRPVDSLDDLSEVNNSSPVILDVLWLDAEDVLTAPGDVDVSHAELILCEIDVSLPPPIVLVLEILGNIVFVSLIAVSFFLFLILLII